MFFMSALNAVSSCRMFHSANIAELEEAITGKPAEVMTDRNDNAENPKSAETRSSRPEGHPDGLEAERPV